MNSGAATVRPSESTMRAYVRTPGDSRTARELHRDVLRSVHGNAYTSLGLARLHGSLEPNSPLIWTDVAAVPTHSAVITVSLSRNVSARPRPGCCGRRSPPTDRMLVQGCVVVRFRMSVASPTGARGSPILGDHPSRVPEMSRGGRCGRRVQVAGHRERSRATGRQSKPRPGSARPRADRPA